MGAGAVLDKMQFCGGNSVRATSGINGALTNTQIEQGIKDSPAIFLRDTALSATKGASDVPEPLHRVLTYESAPAVHWLQDNFDVDLTILGHMGGHSARRCHRGKERFPGMMITYALMTALDNVIKAEGDKRARLITKARVNKLLTEGGEVIGVQYEKGGKNYKEYGPVILCTGGFCADFSEDGFLAKHRPELLHLPTTNGIHCTGDGIKLSTALGAGTVDIDAVQVHPTGLVNPDEPDAKVLFLAAEALRGAGGLLLSNEGKRFCNDMGRRDYVTGEMNKLDKYPYRLVLNSEASKEITWHCKHYQSRNLMKHYTSGADLAADMGIPVSNLEKTFADYNKGAEAKSDPFGKVFWPATPFTANDSFYVAIVEPVIHYAMGGVKIGTDSAVQTSDGTGIPGLFAGGEVAGGVHGLNRLGGSSLLDCVVFGRVSGASATRYLLNKISVGDVHGGPPGSVGSGGGGATGSFTMTVSPGSKNVVVSWDGSAGASAGSGGADTPSSDSNVPLRSSYDDDDPPADEGSSADGDGEQELVPDGLELTMEEVAKHTTEDDVWVVVNGKVLAPRKFLMDHPGVKKRS
eukprot:TRINITY_DN1064_c0_g1_i3.p1 TRINITY_DN1064_c0_g1~~TRINITY_DN1064_c0_g1_i3.p1  ORF type:complete len:598 (-),score=193.41 TRINITY_DN1064_c0_g1_i3:278-2011(-)